MPQGRKNDVEYVVYSQREDGDRVTYTSWPEACAAAIRGSVADMTAYVLDVFVRNARGAQRFAGNYGVRQWAERGDPDHVFERIEVRADSLGAPS